MSKNVYIGIAVIVILIVAGIVFASRNSMTQQNSNVPAQSSNQTQQPSIKTPSPTTSNSQAKQATQDSFTIDADDENASMTQLNVAKGHKISVTFNVKNGSTYHGGLDFRSDAVTTGTIPTGTSKTVTFTADKSFTWVPYWPASNIKKPYTISVNVQ